MKRIVAVVLCLVVLAGCSSGDENRSKGLSSGTPTASPSASFAIAQALIDTEDGSVLLKKVEIADNDATREVGLMGRSSLDPDAGMAFIFFEESTAGFWMKNTLIPLSIAFFDKDGKIVRILDMEPCTKDPCPTYSPGVGYFGALEVNKGAFERWGAKPGDRITIAR